MNETNWNLLFSCTFYNLDYVEEAGIRLIFMAEICKIVVNEQAGYQILN
jgi:hypothetical protein